jgi:hypothetical protein
MFDVISLNFVMCVFIIISYAETTDKWEELSELIEELNAIQYYFLIFLLPWSYLRRHNKFWLPFLWKRYDQTFFISHLCKV